MSDVDIRMKQFHSLMEPALHIFPPYLIRDLEANGFFTAPASTKYHGAFEGGLFEHSRNVTQVLITQYDTVLWTHHADMIASHILEDAR